MRVIIKGGNEGSFKIFLPNTLLFSGLSAGIIGSVVNKKLSEKNNSPDVNSGEDELELELEADELEAELEKTENAEELHLTPAEIRHFMRELKKMSKKYHGMTLIDISDSNGEGVKIIL